MVHQISVTDTAAYALEITGDSMLPVYRQGDIIIVSPNATVRNGDRVIVKTGDGKIVAKIMRSRTPDKMEFASFTDDLDVACFKTNQIDWVARVIWASQ